MELSKAIGTRKSVRSFEKRQVPRNILKLLVREASKAPSSSNIQPWRFYVVRSKKARDRITGFMRKALELYKADFSHLPPKLQKASREFYSDLGGCQNIIFLYSDNNKGGKEGNIISISLAAENLMLSAVDKGLGTCWVGSLMAFENEIDKIVKPKKGERLVGSILIGYPSEEYVPLKREKKGLEQILKFV